MIQVYFIQLAFGASHPTNITAKCRKMLEHLEMFVHVFVCHRFA